MLKIPKKKLNRCRVVRYTGATIGVIGCLFIALFSVWETVAVSQALWALTFMVGGLILNGVGMVLESRLHACPRCGNQLMRMRYGDGSYSFRYRAKLPQYCEECGWKVQIEIE